MIVQHPISSSTSCESSGLQQEAREKPLVTSKAGGKFYREMKMQGRFKEAESNLPSQCRHLTKTAKE